MSLTKLLKAPIKLFKKEVITFLIVRRYDLGKLEDKLRYVSVRPTASISMLRQKVWHLLDLPDYCEEIIVLKTDADREIPLTDLRKGNDPQHAYILEVWLPEKSLLHCTSTIHNMLTIGNGDVRRTNAVSNTTFDEEQDDPTKHCNPCEPSSTVSNETVPLARLRVPDKRATSTLLFADYKKSELSCRISSSSLFKLHSRKSRDNFTNILLTIQNDLSTLSQKLAALETKLPN